MRVRRTNWMMSQPLPHSFHTDPRVLKRTRKAGAWRWIAGGALALTGTLALAAGAGLAWLYTGLPQQEGRLTLTKLDHEVGVYRDRDGIPHIFARSPSDAWRALGYVHAQDRLAQMELMRRLGSGRLAEVVGSAGLKSDKFMRRMGLALRVQDDYANLKADTRLALDAYAEGVNSFIANRPGAWPVEIYAMGGHVAPWKPTDSLLWGKLMAMSLTGNWRDEALRARLAGAGLSKDQIAFLFETVPGPVTLPDLELGSLAEPLRRTLTGVPEAGEPRTASNVWALSGAKTDSGKPHLVNDPHLGFTAPDLWYLARIVTPGLTLTGATVPGVPFHILGQNGSIAWGLTTTGADMQDLVIERINKDDPDLYDTPTGPRPFLTRTEVIKVRGGDDVTLTVRETRNGPVISDGDADLGTLAGEAHVLALKATYLEARDTAADALFQVGRAANWSDFRDALRSFTAPMQNFTAAGRDGTIGMIAAGHLPIRRNHDGWLPVEGWTGNGDWVETVSLDQLPQRTNPDSGVLANANNRIVDARYPHLVAREWDDPFRAQRLETVLKEKAPRSLEMERNLLTDSTSAFAGAILPQLLKITTRTQSNAAILDRMAAWDKRMSRAAGEPLIFAAWLRRLMEGVFADDVAVVANEPWQPRHGALLRALTEAPVWCDDIRTKDVVEDCGTIATRALDTALLDISNRYGKDPKAWTWGEAHMAVHEHPAFGRLPILGSLFNLTIETDGGFDTLNRGVYRGRPGDDFAHRHGAGFRAVYDLNDPDQSTFMIATGQSGNILSQHYDDLLKPWRDGEQRPITGSPADLAKRGASVLTLTPQ